MRTLCVQCLKCELVWTTKEPPGAWECSRCENTGFFRSRVTKHSRGVDDEGNIGWVGVIEPGLLFLCAEDMDGELTVALWEE